MMMANSRNAYQWNQSQERPLRETAANGRNLAAVTNRAVYIVLLEYLDLALGLLRGNLSSRNKRRSCRFASRNQ